MVSGHMVGGGGEERVGGVHGTTPTTCCDAISLRGHAAIFFSSMLKSDIKSPPTISSQPIRFQRCQPPRLPP